MNGVRRWFDALSPGPRLIVDALSILVAAVVLVQGIQTVAGGSSPSGPTSSSYATSPQGVAAYASLLAGSGVPVGQRRVPLSEGVPVPGAATLFVLGVPQIGDDELDALRRFLDDGGRLVAGGLESSLWVDRLVGTGLSAAELVDDQAQAVTAGPSGAQRITVATRRGFDPATVPGDAVVIAAVDGVPVAVEVAVRNGTVVALSDLSALENQELAALDNAAYGVDLAGGRPSVFAEAPHGYGPRGGLGGLPARWRWALWFALAAAAAWMVSRARRNGPPEVPVRDLPPGACREYVDALGVTLARVRHHGGSSGSTPAAPPVTGEDGKP